MSELDAVRKIGEVIVGAGGQANIAFSNIPQTYRSLEIIGLFATSAAVGATNLNLQFNGDTGTNYDTAIWVSNDGNATSPGGSNAGGQISVGLVCGTSTPTAQAGGVRFTVPDYAQTTFRKSVLGSGSYSTGDGSGGFAQLHFAGQWRSAAAITSILLFPSSGNFVQGSVTSLYGIL